MSLTARHAISPPSQFRFTIGRSAGAVVVTLHGEMDRVDAEVLADALADLITDQGNLSVVIDLSELDGLDATSVAVFVTASEWADQRGGRLILHGPLPIASAALLEAGLSDSECTGARSRSRPGASARLRVLGPGSPPVPALSGGAA